MSGRRQALRRLSAGTALVVAGVLPAFLTAGLATRLGRSFDFGPSDLGLAVAAFYVVSAVGSTPAGRFVDHAGAGPGIRWSGATIGAACLAIAVLAQSSAAVAVLLVVAGAGNALAGPAATALFRAEVPADRHGLGLGMLQAGAPLGALLAGLALPVVAIPFGWRWTFVGAAVVAIGAALGVGSLRGARRAAPSAPAPSPRLDEAPPARSEVRVLGLVSALASGAVMGVVSFLVLYAVDSGMSEGAAGMLLAAVSLGAVVGRIVVGATADRLTGDPMATVAVLLLSSVAGYLLLLTGEPAGIAVGAMIVSVAGWSWPGALTVAIVSRSATAPAWAVGVMMTGLFLGAMGGPFVVGQIVERGHTSLPWIACAAVAALAAGTAATTVRPRRARRP